MTLKGRRLARGAVVPVRYHGTGTGTGTGPGTGTGRCRCRCRCPRENGILCNYRWSLSVQYCTGTPVQLYLNKT